LLYLVRLKSFKFQFGDPGRLQLSKVFQDGDAQQVGGDELYFSIMCISRPRYDKNAPVHPGRFALVGLHDLTLTAVPCVLKRMYAHPPPWLSNG